MTSFTSRYGNPAEDYEGVHLWTHCRHSVTVVAVAGLVDTDNLGHVKDHVRRYVTGGTPLVLDLSRLTAFTPELPALLEAVDRQCEQAGLQWALVAADPVAGMLSAASGVPAAGTVAEAEHRFDDAIAARRRGLLPLFAKSA